MSRYGLIQNGKVVNLIECDEAFANSNNLILLPNNVDINDLYENGVFTKAPNEQVAQPTTPTKEQLLAQLQALTTQINSLE